MPRGGRRPGSGRKPKSATVLGIDGVRHAQWPAVVPDVAQPVEQFGPPEGLIPEVLAVWRQQAPHAFEMRTLARATEVSFERYCRAVVLEQRLGLTAPGGADHRGILRQVNAYELQFLLTPCGKAMRGEQKQAQPESKLAKYRRG